MTHITHGRFQDFKRFVDIVASRKSFSVCCTDECARFLRIFPCKVSENIILVFAIIPVQVCENPPQMSQFIYPHLPSHHIFVMLSQTVRKFKQILCTNRWWLLSIQISSCLCFRFFRIISLLHMSSVLQRRALLSSHSCAR